MHPAHEHLLRFFDYEHLPEDLQEISSPFRTLAFGLIRNVDLDVAELTVALRKLLEAKDAAVRSRL